MNVSANITGGAGVAEDKIIDLAVRSELELA